MSNGVTPDFAAMYRAAFAERNPEKKLALLRNVEETLLTWRIADEQTPVLPKSASSDHYPRS